MQRRPRQQTRRGTILPFLALSLVAICGFAALAVDIGMIVVAKGQCQNAADAAAMAGARSVDGSPSANLAAATANAKAAAEANIVLGQNVQADEVAVSMGTYHYDPNTQKFAPAYPPFPAPQDGFSADNYNLCSATVTHTVQYAFARVFNLTSLNVSATAIAAHRPRDVAIVLDYSGSMNNESDLWNNETYLGTANNSSNNTDPVFPQWGWYDPNYSPLAQLQCTSADPRVGKSNVTQSVLGVPAMVTNYYQNNRGSSAQPAFTPAPGSVTSTTPGGDLPLTKYTGTTVAKTWGEAWGAGTPPAGTVFDGYTARGTFYGYTQGPGYWGKTFFIWPPNPRNDWRENYFMATGGSYPSFGGKMNDNTKLYSTTGVFNDPAGNYVVNYAAILNFIKNVGPNPFPAQLRAGNILYYTSIPNDIQASAYDHTQPNRNITDQDQRFWKEYIDYTLGVWRDPYGNIQHTGHPACSIGPDFTAGTATAGQYVQIRGPTTTYKDPTGDPFIDPADNPQRPRHRFWFGPMTMIQYLSDTGLFPGTATDISMVAAKLGIQGALTDIQTNHPNDVVSMLLFSRPNYLGEPAEVGAFSAPQYNLSRDYAGMINSLWFPPNSGASDVRPWDVNGTQTPRAHGDYTGNTATSYGFMLAYNQFSSQVSLRTAGSGGSGLGGFGRKGAQRLVILETDGMANVSTQQLFSNVGPYNSYYDLTPGTLRTSGVAPGTDAIQIATRICALTTDNSTGPGFALPNKPVLIHCIAFGAIFEPTAAGSEASSAFAMLQQLSQIGGTGFPSSVTATGDPNYYKLCIGTLSQRQQKLRTAFSKIMDDGISVVMVK
ncbi:MAG TPA: pilus assembly protein TadG-related protein [Gemmataceae bacterium]|nr:pilus assembly protein TadG-related protein [Gemmataceae bacterium]